jgi:hypothetical protein
MPIISLTTRDVAAQRGNASQRAYTEDQVSHEVPKRHGELWIDLFTVAAFGSRESLR